MGSRRSPPCLAEPETAWLGLLGQGGSLGHPGVLCDDRAKAARCAAKLDGCGARIVVADPGDKSVLDFAAGDSITLEAWVSPARVGEGQQMYVVGKGRTGNRGFAAENQNCALRCADRGAPARLSFLLPQCRQPSRSVPTTSIAGTPKPASCPAPAGITLR